MKDLINKDSTWLVDVRTPEEVRERSVPGADNIPMDAIMEKLPRLKEHDGPLVFFCASGNRSGQVAQYLKQSGMDEVYNAGGIGDVLALKEN